MDPFVGAIFGQAQLVQAVRDHRRIAGREVEPAGVKLGEVGQHRGGGGAFVRDHRGQFAGQDGMPRRVNE